MVVPGDLRHDPRLPGGSDPDDEELAVRAVLPMPPR